uniref:GATA-type domain-containing protein n=1 Tax=Heterorhabditis bacteriophora TaxID=37862 RepID=A0A1I7WL69_HETBA
MRSALYPRVFTLDSVIVTKAFVESPPFCDKKMPSMKYKSKHDLKEDTFLFGGLPNLFGCNPCSNGYVGYSQPQPYYQSPVDSYHPFMNSYAHSQAYQQRSYQTPHSYSDYHQQEYQHPEPSYNQHMPEYHSPVSAYQEPQPEYHPAVSNYHESEPIEPSTEGYIQPSAPVFYSSAHPQSSYNAPQENIVVKETEILESVAPASITNQHSTAVVEEKTFHKTSDYETPVQVVSEPVSEVAPSYSSSTTTSEASGY